MDFHPVATDTADNILPAIKYILDLDISPLDKTERIKKVINLIGSDFYVQMFDANSEVFDSAALGTADYNEMTGHVDTLATKIVRQHSLGRVVDQIVSEFYDTALGRAQEEAFSNALSLGKHPTVTRSLVGETCDWCRNLVGTHIYPEGKYFARHDNCDCLIVVSGYNSRNGVVSNYTKISRNRDELAVRDQNVVVQDATEEVLQTATPHVGSINYAANWPEKQKVGEEEQKFASWLLNTLGGDITYMPTVEGRKTPDYLWDGVNSELKTLSTRSLNQLSSKIREASTQAGDNGTIFLDLTDATDLWTDEVALFTRVEQDLKRFDASSILIKRDNSLIKYYKKEAIPPPTVAGSSPLIPPY